MDRLLCIVIRANNVASYSQSTPRAHLSSFPLQKKWPWYTPNSLPHLVILMWELCHVFVMFSTSTAKMLLGVVARRMTLSGGGTLQHVSPECWHSRVLRFPGACVKDLELFKTAKCEKKALIWRHMIRPGHRLWFCVSQLNNICPGVLRNS